MSQLLVRVRVRNGHFLGLVVLQLWKSGLDT